MQRYFVSCPTNENIVINKDDIFHIKNVMRMKVGDQFEINNDGDIILAEITSLNEFDFKIVEVKEENHELNGYVRLIYCLPKGDKTELVIQKAVELGASEVVLVNSTRSIAKITKENKDKKLIRFNKIIKEASEQSKRTKLMKMDEVITFKELDKFKGDINLIAYENTEFTSNDLYAMLNSIKGKTINVIVGAEGGITKEELDIAKRLNYKEISLGKRILRSETACIYILSLLSFYLEN